MLIAQGHCCCIFVIVYSSTSISCSKIWIEAHVYFCMMGESCNSSNWMTLAIATEPNPTSHLPPICFSDLGGSFAEQASCVNSIEDIIEKSKSHWSQVGEFDLNNEVAEVSNMELFQTLQRHPTWGSFFKTFGKSKGSYGKLLMGEKFAEGGQAELYEAHIDWFSERLREVDLNASTKYVLKVFKKGTFLRHLQSQWPQGMLQFHADSMSRVKLGLHQPLRFQCEVFCATLLEDGRFAFAMVREQEDLRSMINRQMLTRSNNKGPFSRRDALLAMYQVAFGMNQLHNRGIVHRDIKASNVLVASNMICLIADFECSVGVVGTGFFRAPEILEACKHGNVSTKTELFTKAIDIYSYGMTCYEILTGKLPFEGHPRNDYDFVIQGQRPKVPNYVDGWIQKLLNRCWQSNPVARPSFQEILKILVANSAICMKQELQIQNIEVRLGIRKALERHLIFVDMWRLIKWKIQKLKMFRLCRR